MNFRFLSIVHASIFGITFIPFCIASLCYAQPPGRERFSPIDSTLIILDVPKNPCEYGEPFIICTGIHNPFSDTIWIGEFWEGDELELTGWDGKRTDLPQKGPIQHRASTTLSRTILETPGTDFLLATLALDQHGFHVQTL